jgi:hypothetical protein
MTNTSKLPYLKEQGINIFKGILRQINDKNTKMILTT